MPKEYLPKEYSPFTPGVPVPIDFFVGRKEEIEHLRRSVNQVLHGRQENVFLIGERGIGKSSLASYFRLLAETQSSLLSVHVYLGGVNTIEETIRRIYDKLLKDSLDKPWHKKILDFLGKHVKQVGLFGIDIEFVPTIGDLQSLSRNFMPSLEKLLKEITDSKKGLLIALDDINGLSGNADFANWYKSLVDEIATSQKIIPVIFMLIGLSERRYSLINLQPSLSRIFSIIEIKPLSIDETKEFYERSFSKVGKKITPDALDRISTYSGGLPMLVHEIGDAVFRIDVDDNIDKEDAWTGIMFAADIVGSKYLGSTIHHEIRSESYRSILLKIGDWLPSRHTSKFRKKDVESKLTEREKKVFHNFLRRMIKLGVIVTEPELGRGGYRFDNELYRIYLELEGLRRQIQALRRKIEGVDSKFKYR